MKIYLNLNLHLNLSLERHLMEMYGGKDVEKHEKTYNLIDQRCF